MAAKNPRVLTVLEMPLYRAVTALAHSEQVSISQKVRDLVKEALETHEDSLLLAFAEKREKTFDRKKALTHEQVWHKNGR